MLYAAQPLSTAAATPSPLISNSGFIQTGPAGLNAEQACLVLLCVESHLRDLPVPSRWLCWQLLGWHVRARLTGAL